MHVFLNAIQTLFSYDKMRFRTVYVYMPDRQKLVKLLLKLLIMK